MAVSFSWILDLLAALRLADGDKDLELLILRQQIAILERNADRPKLSRIEKLTLAVLVQKIKVRTGITCRRLADSIFIFTPKPFSAGIESLSNANGPSSIDVNLVDLVSIRP